MSPGRYGAVPIMPGQKAVAAVECADAPGPGGVVEGANPAPSSGGSGVGTGYDNLFGATVGMSSWRMSILLQREAILSISAAL